MASVNKVILLGHLGRDPEQRTFANGVRVAYLALATRFYAEIVTQLRGLTHAEGGPVGGGSDDPGELRWSVRSDGHRGYLFLTTYQPPKRPIAAQPGVSVTLDFEDATITVPSAPVTEADARLLLGRPPATGAWRDGVSAPAPA